MKVYPDPPSPSPLRALPYLSPVLAPLPPRLQQIFNTAAAAKATEGVGYLNAGPSLVGRFSSMDLVLPPRKYEPCYPLCPPPLSLLLLLPPVYVLLLFLHTT